MPFTTQTKSAILHPQIRRDSARGTANLKSLFDASMSKDVSSKRHLNKMYHRRDLYPHHHHLLEPLAIPFTDRQAQVDLSSPTWSFQDPLQRQVFNLHRAQSPGPCPPLPHAQDLDQARLPISKSLYPFSLTLNPKTMRILPAACIRLKARPVEHLRLMAHGEGAIKRSLRR